MTTDLTAVLAAAQLCARAYTDKPTVQNTQTDTQVLMRQFDGVLSIAHRGTCNIPGWIRDLMIRQGGIASEPRCCEAKIHDGFYRDVTSVIDDIRANIPSRQTPILYTGHSKGAAEAEIAAWRLHCEGYNVTRVITFGKPRTGNALWAQLYDGSLGPVTIRVTHAADVVPWIPWLLGRYRQTAHELWLKAGGGMVSDPGLWRKLAGTGGEIALEYLRVKWRAGAALFTDHPIAKYLAPIQEAMS
jgi:predicted lipase